MSAKAFDALSKSSDVSSVPQTAQSQVNQDDEDRKKLLVKVFCLIHYNFSSFVFKLEGNMQLILLLKERLQLLFLMMENKHRQKDIL